jgi:HD-GYP domain-containing protein (c-di-GMP phosphodiesterase class II)
MQLLRLVQSQVQLGVALPWGVRDASGQLLLARGQVLHDSAQLDALLARGATVDASEVRAAAAAAAAARAAQQSASNHPATLFALWEKLLWELERVLKSASEPEGFVARVEAVATHLVALVDRDPDIAIFLAVRQNPRRFSVYPLTHATHTAVVVLLMARRMGWPAAQVLTLVKAALTMNIATLPLQGRMAAQGVGITPEQHVIVRAHPVAGAAMLEAAGVSDAEWLAAVRQHHEQPDGTGYPAGLTEIVPPAQALRLADVFLAKISPRAMRAALGVQEAQRQLFRGTEGSPMAMAIIKEFGIYPPGEFVTLRNGEYAVVVRRGVQAAAPLASAITDRAGVPTIHTVRRDTARPEFAIVGLVADKTLVERVPPERLYGI